MTIQQYLKKIKVLSITENISKNFNHNVLDNLAMKISLDNNNYHLNLSDLELVSDRQNENSQKIILNPEIINQISDCLGLQFINEKQTEGNVCFINSNELRPEFRQSFTSMDVLDYCYAVLDLSINKISAINSASIPITSESSVFWKFVKHGSELRKEDLLK
jgi:hypothetical protein